MTTMKKSIILLFSLIAYSCAKDTANQNRPMESPLSSVVKLMSAESFGHLEEAEKYIDVESVYSKHLDDTIDVKSIWKQQIDFKTSLNKTSKFTGHFKYFQYKIKETINDNEASVLFIPNNEESKIKEIKYSLIVQDGRWKVVQIDYLNK
jgi:hypothetical protein